MEFHWDMHKSVADTCHGSPNQRCKSKITDNGSILQLVHVIFLKRYDCLSAQLKIRKCDTHKDKAPLNVTQLNGRAKGQNAIIFLFLQRLPWKMRRSYFVPKGENIKRDPKNIKPRKRKPPTFKRSVLITTPLRKLKSPWVVIRLLWDVSTSGSSFRSNPSECKVLSSKERWTKGSRNKMAQPFLQEHYRFTRILAWLARAEDRPFLEKSYIFVGTSELTILGIFRSFQKLSSPSKRNALRSHHHGHARFEQGQNSAQPNVNSAIFPFDPECLNHSPIYISHNI